MADFHRHMLDQLPKSWMPIIAQGVKVVISREGVKFDLSEAPLELKIPCPAELSAAFPSRGSDGYGRWRKSLRTNQDAA
jgi:hypothetical protein